MIFYCDHESLTVDQNTTFDGFHIDFLRECLERVKNFGKITRDQLDKMRIGSKSVKNIAFKINDVSYYSGIIQIDICNKKNIKNSDIEELFEPNTFLFDFNDQDDNLLAVTVFYRCSKNKFTFDDNSACSPISVSNGKTVAIMCFEQINLSSDKLSCYEIYFEFLKKDLNNHKAEYEIDTNLFREYFQQILKATPDDNTLMLPILNFEKFKRITSAELVYENGKKDIPSRFSFQETDFSVPNRDEQENFVKRLNDEFDVVIPWKKSHRFVRLENLSNADMYKAINILLNEENKNIKLSEDTKGDEIRLDRILDGIKAVEKGHVANKDLVKAICENSIEKFKENYHPNAKRIEAH